MGKQKSSKYYLFIDECGDHCLATYDRNFPIFILCGILVPHYHFNAFKKAIDSLKLEFWDTTEVIKKGTLSRTLPTGRYYSPLNRCLRSAKYFFQGETALSNAKYEYFCIVQNKNTNFTQKVHFLLDSIGKNNQGACCFFHSFVVILYKLGCGSEEQN